MHFNYHFLKFLCPALETRFLGAEIVECFSQNKDELIFGLSLDKTNLYIQANLLPSISCLSFPDDFKRGKRNTVSLFPDLIGQKISQVKPISFERAFVIYLESGDRIIFKLHGTRSNILFYKGSEELPYKIFRNELRDDWNIRQAELAKDLDLSKSNFLALEGNASKFLPTLGKIPREWLKEKGYIETTIEEKWTLLEELLDMLDSPLFSIVEKGKDHYLSLLPEEKSVLQTDDPIIAVNTLFRYIVVIQAFQREKQHWFKTFEDQKKKSSNYIQKTAEKLQSLESDISPAQLADVIMANLHQIERNAEEVTLFNFYTNQDQLVKLKRGVSPQLFAENLYRKSKNRKIEIDQLYQNLEDKENLLAKTETLIEQLKGVTDFRTLKAFVKEHNLIAQEKDKQEQIPFKRFDVEGFEVLVGKSAKSNDEMLRYFAWKEDLWLHAKDVSGSHVIIKHKSGINFPKTVIERAAELAAYYSKNKSETLAAVMYTPVKFVRKVKGSPAGAVMVDKESVVIVPPVGPRE
ncbi:putative RNA-binding protein, snRNP like protein [Belliella baltica DSM 15883]|uniref:Putative RNA-binding protein, snRNP like protein n=1 Tax=Belliella baltica (strain DSM 15883 / CIP 108006 / LMG 21964 / BA134) TaxID=866536 RepID=I3Z9G6_BELBD|nr:putative RNA-binding protein, snRNP like protein [Belliella baltica DSM 15883]